eukprot:m.72249 g.72249  ORF g.72249 m.72249 type:complete len:151 (+) comp24440_c1_seq1:116-568(+)
MSQQACLPGEHNALQEARQRGKRFSKRVLLGDEHAVDLSFTSKGLTSELLGTEDVVEELSKTTMKPTQTIKLTAPYRDSLPPMDPLTQSYLPKHGDYGFQSPMTATMTKRSTATSQTSTYQELPTDIYRKMAENQRGWGIGSKLQVNLTK